MATREMHEGGSGFLTRLGKTLFSTEGIKIKTMKILLAINNRR